MTNLKYAYHILCKHFLMSVLVIIQLSISFLLLHGMLTYSSYKYSTVIAFEPLSDVNGLHFSTELASLPRKTLEELGTAAHADIISGVTYFDTHANIVYYNPEFTKYYKPNIISGSRLSDCRPSSTKNIPVIAFGNHKVGDIMRSDLLDINYEVIGVSDDKHYFSFDSYGAQTGTQMVMQPTNNKLFLSLINDTVSEYLDIYDKKVTLFCADPDCSLEELHENLLQYGYVNSFDDINEHGKESAFEVLRVFIPFFGFMLVISIVGVIGCANLNVLKHIKMFSVFLLIGCTTKKCVSIVFIYVVLMIAVSLLIFGIVQAFIFSPLSAPFATISAFLVFLECLITLSFSTIPFFIIKNHKPIVALKRQ